MKSVKKLENLKNELFNTKIKFEERNISGGTGCGTTAKFGTLDPASPDVIFN